MTITEQFKVPDTVRAKAHLCLIGQQWSNPKFLQTEYAGFKDIIDEDCKPDVLTHVYPITE